MTRLFLILLFAIFAGPAQAAMEDYPSVQIKALDKSTARTTTMDVKVGETFQFGSLFIKVQACRKADPIEPPESAAFLQIWEVPPEQTESQWVFSGWMFASSPALSAMDHPVYDVWVLDCTGKEPEPAPEAETAAEETEQAADMDEGQPAENTTENSPDTTPATEEPLLD